MDIYNKKFRWTSQKHQFSGFIVAVVVQCSEKSCSETFSKKNHINKAAGLRSATLFKKRLWHRCFPVNFAEFLRTPFVENTSKTAASEFTWKHLYWSLFFRRKQVNCYF